MTALVVQSAVFLLALVAVVARFTQLADRREQAWTQERSELLNRIQHPERIPASREEWAPRPEPEPDGLVKVGRIDHEDAA